MLNTYTDHGVDEIDKGVFEDGSLDVAWAYIGSYLALEGFRREGKVSTKGDKVRQTR